MSIIRKILKSASQVVTDSGINTCYTSPQTKKNRIPASFEQLEPRQLLSATQVEADSNISFESTIVEPVIVTIGEGFNTAGDAVKNTIDLATADLVSIYNSVTGFIGDTYGGIVGEIPSGEFNYGDVNIDGSVDFSRATQTINHDSNIGLYMSINGDVTLDTIHFNDDIKNAANSTIAIMANGTVNLRNIDFTGIETIIIRADFVYLDGIDINTAQGDANKFQVIAMDSIAIGNATDPNSSQDITVNQGASSSINEHTLDFTAMTSLKLLEGASIVDDGVLKAHVNFTAPDISITGTGITADKSIDIGGDFVAFAKEEAFLHPLLGFLPIRFSSGDARITVDNASIEASNVQLEAYVQTEAAYQFPDLGEISGNVYVEAIYSAMKDHAFIEILHSMGLDVFTPDVVDSAVDAQDAIAEIAFGPYAAPAIPGLSFYTQFLTQPLSDVLTTLMDQFTVELPFYVSTATAEAVVEIKGNTQLTATDGDLNIVATSSVINEADSYVDIIGINILSNSTKAKVLIGENDTDNINLYAKNDINIASFSTNTNESKLIAIFAPAARKKNGESKSKHSAISFAFGMTMNQALASVVIGRNVNAVAENDVNIKSLTVEELTNTVKANSTWKGLLGIAVAINTGGGESLVSVKGNILAKEGDVNINSNIITNITTMSSTVKGLLFEAAPPPHVDPRAMDAFNAVAVKVITNLLRPFGGLMETKNLGLGTTVAYASHGSAANTIIGSTATITSQFGSVNLHSQADTTPVIESSSSSSYAVEAQVTQGTIYMAQNNASGEKNIKSSSKNPNTGAAVAVGISTLSTNAETIVEDGAKINYNQRVDITSDANYFLPSTFRTLAGFQLPNLGAPIEIDFGHLGETLGGFLTMWNIEELTSFINGIGELQESLQQEYLDLQDAVLGQAFNLDSVNGNQGFAVPNSYVYASTGGAKSLSISASMAYIKQDNNSKVSVGDNVSIMRVGGATSSDIRSGGTIQLDDAYSNLNGLVTYEVYAGGTSLNGLIAGEEYYAVVDANGLLTLYHNNSGTQGSKITLGGNTNDTRHYFIFEKSKAVEFDYSLFDNKWQIGTTDNTILAMNSAHGMQTGDIVNVSSTSGSNFGLDANSLYMVFARSTTELSFKKIENGKVVGDFIVLSITDDFASDDSNKFYSISEATASEKENLGLSFTLTTAEYNSFNNETYDVFNGFSSGDIIRYTSTGAAISGLSSGSEYVIELIGGSSFMLYDTSGNIINLSLDAAALNSQHKFTKENDPSKSSDDISVYINGNELSVQSIEINGVTSYSLRAQLKGDSFISNTIESLALSTGDVIEYTSTGASIFGLESGKQYEVSVLDGGRLTLRAYDASTQIAFGDYIMLGRQIQGDAEHTFTLVKVYANAPIQVDAVEQNTNPNAIYVNTHDYVTGDKLIVKMLDASLSTEENPVYTQVLGTYTVTRISETMITLQDVNGNYIQFPDFTSDIHPEFLLARPSQADLNTSIVNDANGNYDYLKFDGDISYLYDGGTIILNSDLIYTVTENLYDENEDPILETVQVYDMNGNPVLSPDGTPVTVEQVKTETKTVTLKAGTEVFAKLVFARDANGYITETVIGVRLAVDEQSYLAADYIEIDSYNGTVSIVTEELAVSKDTLNIAQYLFQSTGAHNAQDGTTVTYTPLDTNGNPDINNIRYFTINVFDDYHFSLSEVDSSGELKAIKVSDFMALTSGSFELGKPVEGLLVQTENLIAPLESLSLDNHGLTTGQRLIHEYTITDENGEDVIITTTYYVIVKNANEFYLAESYNHALQGFALAGDALPSVGHLRNLESGIFIESTSSDKTINVTGQLFTGLGPTRGLFPASTYYVPNAPSAAKALFWLDVQNLRGNIKNMITNRYPSSSTGAGASIQILDFSHETQAQVGKGASSSTSLLIGDSLNINSYSDNGIFSFLLAGAMGELKSYSGSLGVIMVDNVTTADLSLGSGSAYIGNSLGGDLTITAKDNTYYTQLSLALNMSETAIGGTAFVQAIDRETIAAIGNENAETATGSVYVTGRADIDAHTTGQNIAAVVGASVATPPDSAQPNYQKPTNPYDAFASSNTNYQGVDAALHKTSRFTSKNNTSNKGGDIDEMVSTYNSNITPKTPAGQTPPPPPPQPAGKSTAIAAQLLVSSYNEETKAIVQNLSTLVVAGFLARAVNDTKQVVVAGALGIALEGGTGGAGSGINKDNLGVGAAIVVTVNDKTAEAYVDNVATMIVSEDDFALDSRDESLNIVIGAGLGAATGGAGGAGTLLANIHESNTKSYIANSDLTVEQGAVHVLSQRDIFMVTVAGGGGFGKSKGIGVSVGINDLSGNTEAYISNSSIQALENIDVLALSGSSSSRSILIDEDTPGNSGITDVSDLNAGYNLISIGASVGVATGGAGGAGAITINIISGETKAYIVGDDSDGVDTILAGENVNVQALDQFGVVSIGGSVAYSSNDQTANPPSSTKSVGFVSSLNWITSKASSQVFNVNIGNNTYNDSHVTVEAISKQDIIAIAGAVAVSAGGNAGAFTLAANVISAGTTAEVNSATIIANQLAVHSANEATILSIAGGVSKSTGGNVAAAIAVNVIDGASMPSLDVDNLDDSFDFTNAGNLDVSATVRNSNITLNGDTDECMQVLAEASSAILSIAAGVSITTEDRTSSMPNTSSSYAGSVSVNVINRSVTATVESSTLNLTQGKLSIVARDFIGSENDGSQILAISGQVGLNFSGNQSGIAIGGNYIGGNVYAGIKNEENNTRNSIINAGELEIEAHSVGEILSLNASVALALSKQPMNTAKSGTIAVNVINKDVTATIENATINAGPISVSAKDSAEILGLAASLAFAKGVQSSTLSGVLAVNVITTNQLANVYNSTIISSGDVDVLADGKNSIHAVNLGAANKGLVLNPNVVVNDTDTVVEKSTITTTGDLGIYATQGIAGTRSTESWISKTTGDHKSDVDAYLSTSGIEFDTNIVAINFNIAANKGDASTIGVGVAVNVVTSNVDAIVKNSSLSSSEMAIESINSAKIIAVTMGIAWSMGGQGTFSGSAMLASNTTAGGATTSIGTSSLTSTNDMSISSRNNADIFALAINAAVSTSGSAGGLFVGVNVIAMDTTTSISGDGISGTIKSGGDLFVQAQDTSNIWAFTVAAAVGTGASSNAVGFANNTSVITGEVKTSIFNMNTIDVGGDFTVNAYSSNLIVNVAIGVAVSTGTGLALQATLSENIIVKDILAEVQTVKTITVGGNMVVDAQEQVPSKIADDWEKASYMKGVGFDESTVNTDGANNAQTKEAGVSVGDGTSEKQADGTHNYNASDALFEPANGIFSLVISVAVSTKGTALSGALNFNWLQRSTSAIVNDVENLRLTSLAPSLNGAKSGMIVNAKSSAAAFGAVVSVAASGKGAAGGLSAAINVLDNETKAILSNSNVGGWSGSYWNDSKLGNVTVDSENISGAVAFVIAVGASGGEAGAGITFSMNLGISSGSSLDLSNSNDEDKKDKARELSQSYSANIESDGASTYTDDSSSTAKLGGESAEASIISSNLYSSGALSVEALQNSALMSINIAVGASAKVGVAFSMGLNLLTTNSLARIENSNSSYYINSGSTTVAATTSGKTWAFLVSVGAAGTLGLAGVFSLSRVEGNAQSYISGGNVRTSGGDVKVSSYANTDMLTVGIAVGAGGTGGGAGAVGLALAGNTVTAEILGQASINIHNGSLIVNAKNETGVVTTSLGVAGAGTGAGAGATAINISDWSEAKNYDPNAQTKNNAQAKDANESLVGLSTSKKSDFQTKASVEANSIKITGNISTMGSVDVIAENYASFVAVLLVVAGSGTGAGAGGLVLNILDSNSHANLSVVNNLSIANSAINVEAKNSTKMWATMLAVAGSGTGAGAGAVALNLGSASSDAHINGGSTSSTSQSQFTARDINVNAQSNADVYALALSVAGSGTGAGVASFAINTLKNATVATISGLGSGRFVINAENVDVLSTNTSTIVASTLGVAGSGSGAGGLSLSINVFSGNALELANIANSSKNIESGTNTLKGLAENTNYNVAESGSYLYLKDTENNSTIFIDTNGVTADKHYIVRRDEHGSETLYSFTKNAISSGAINLSQLYNEETGRYGDFDSIDVNDTFTYRSTKHGASTYASETVEEIKSSAVIIQNVNMTAKSLDALASSKLKSVTVSSGVAGSGGGSGYGSIAISIANNSVQAIIDNSELDINGNMSMEAFNSSKTYNIAIAIAGAASYAGGMGVAISSDSGATTTKISNSTINSTGNIYLKSEASLDILSLNFAIAGSGVYAGAGTISVNILQGTVSSDILGSTITAGGTLSTLANFSKATDSASSLANIVDGNDRENLTAVLYEANTRYGEAQADASKDKTNPNQTSMEYDTNSSADEFKDSLSHSGIVSVSISAAGAGKIAGAGAISINELSGDVATNISNSTITTDIAEIKSSMNSKIQSYVIAAAGGGKLGLSGSIGLNEIAGTTKTIITDTDITVGKKADIIATQELAITGLVGAFAGGSIGVSFGLIINTLSGDVRAGMVNGSLNGRNQSSSDAYITAYRATDVKAYAIGVGLGAGALSGGVAENTLKGSTKAFMQDVSASTLNDMYVIANENINSTTIGVQASIGAIAVSAGVAITSATGTVTSEIVGSNSKFENINNLKVLSDSNADLSIKGIGAAVGGLSVGVIISEIEFETDVLASISGANISSVNSVEVTGDGDWNLYSFSLAGAGGVLAVTGADSKVNITGSVDSHIDNSSLHDVRNIDVNAYATPKAKAVSVSPAIGIAGAIGVALATANISPTIKAFVDNINVTHSVYYDKYGNINSNIPVVVPNVSINAELRRPTTKGVYNAETTSFALSTGILFSGAGAGSTTTNNATLMAYARNLRAATLNSLEVVANLNPSLYAYSTGVGVSYFIAGVGAATSDLDSDATTYAFVTNIGETEVLNNFTVHAISNVYTKQEAVAGSGAIGLAISASAANQVLNGTTKTSIGYDYDLSKSANGNFKADTINLKANNIFDIKLSTNSVSVGNLSGAGGEPDLEAAMTTEILIAKDAKLEATDIRILAQSEILRYAHENTTYSTAVGLLTVNAGGTQNDLAADTKVIIAENAQLLATGRASDKDYLIVQAYNILDVHDRLSFVSAGIVGVPAIASTMYGDFSTDIILEKGASVKTEHLLGSDVILHSASYEGLDLNTGVKLFGLASSGALSSIMEIDSTNTITIKDSASVYSSRDLVLSTGALSYEYDEFIAFNNRDVHNSENARNVDNVKLDSWEMLVSLYNFGSTSKPQMQTITGVETSDLNEFAKLVYQGKITDALKEYKNAANAILSRFVDDQNQIDPANYDWTIYDDAKIKEGFVKEIGGGYVYMSGNIYDITFFPISVTDGYLNWNQTNLLDIQVGGLAQAKADAKIYTDRGGLLLRGDTIAHNWTTEAFGKYDTTDISDNFVGKALINGVLEGGVKNDVDATLYALDEATWNKYKDSSELDPSEKERIENALAIFESVFNVSYWEYLKDPEGFEENTLGSDALSNLAWSNFVNSLPNGTNLFDLGISDYAEFILETYASNNIDTLIAIKDKSPGITSSDLSDLIKSIDINGIETAYKAAGLTIADFWRGLYDANVSYDNYGNMVTNLTKSERDFINVMIGRTIDNAKNTQLVSREGWIAIANEYIELDDSGNITWNGPFDSGRKAFLTDFYKALIDNSYTLEGILIPYVATTTDLLNAYVADHDNGASVNWDYYDADKLAYGILDSSKTDANARNTSYVSVRGWEDFLDAYRDSSSATGWSSVFDSLMAGNLTNFDALIEALDESSSRADLDSILSGYPTTSSTLLNKYVDDHGSVNWHTHYDTVQIQKDANGAALDGLFNGGDLKFDSTFWSIVSGVVTKDTNGNLVTTNYVGTMFEGLTLGERGQARLLGYAQGNITVANNSYKNTYDTYFGVYTASAREQAAEAFKAKAGIGDALNDLQYIAVGTSTDQIKVSVDVEGDTYGSTLVNEYKMLQNIYITYGAESSVGKDAYAQMVDLQDDLVNYGYGEMSGSRFTFKPDAKKVTVTVEDILISKGNVLFFADTVEGDGTVAAYGGDAKFILKNEIENSTLVVDDLTVAANFGGEVRSIWGEIKMDSSNIIATQNGTPLLAIYQNMQYGLLEVGDITNLSGVVSLVSLGDIHITGNVSAKSQSASAAGTYTLENKEHGAIHSVGGTPIGVDPNDPNNLEFVPGAGIFSFGDIDIKAAYINVNGLIQSGVKSYTIHIDGTDTYENIWLDDYGNASTESGSRNSYISAYYYDAAKNAYVLNPYIAGNGVVRLNGQVINTNDGYGQIKVYSDPTINITNTTDKHIIISDLQAGVDGTENYDDIDDLTAAQKAELFTESGIYIKQPGDSSYRMYTGGSFTPTDSSFKYHYRIASTSETKETFSYTTKKWIGIDDLARDDGPHYKSHGDKVTVENSPVDDTGGYITTNGITYAKNQGLLYDADDEAVKTADINSVDTLFTGIMEQYQELKGTVSLWGFSFDIYETLERETYYSIDSGTGVSGDAVRYSELTSEVPTYHDPHEWSEGAFLWKITYVKNSKTVSSSFKNVLWIVLDTNHDIDLTRGSGNGKININNTGTGTIYLDGNISTFADINIDTNGSIEDFGNSYISGETIDIDAKGNIGSVNNTIKLAATDTALELKGANIYAETFGARLDNTVLIHASAEGVVNINANGAGLKGYAHGSEVILTAHRNIGSERDNFIIDNTVDQSKGVIVTVKTNTGDIFLNSGDNDMHIVQVSTVSGDINLITNTTSSSGSTTGAGIYDYNDLQQIDQQDIDRLEDMWSSLDLLKSDNVEIKEVKLAETVEVQTENYTSIYHSFFKLQSDIYAATGITEYAKIISVDPEYGFNGDVDAAIKWIEDGLFEYRRILNSFDPSLLTSPYDADLEITVTTLTPQQAINFREVAEKSVFTRTELVGGLVARLYNNSTSTLVTEQANIIGNNVNIETQELGQYGIDRAYFITNYSIKLANDSFSDEERVYLAQSDVSEQHYSQSDDIMSIRLSAYTVEDYAKKISGEIEFTDLDRFYIWSSEKPDRIENPDGSMTIRMLDDVNILLKGGVLNVNAINHALIGTGIFDIGDPNKVDLTVGTITVSAYEGELRVKADGNLYQDVNGLGLSTNSGYMVAEASNGDIGKIDQNLLVGTHDTLRLRGFGSMFVESDYDLNIDAINNEAGKGKVVSLTANGKTITISDKNVVLQGTLILSANEAIIGEDITETISVLDDTSITVRKGDLELTSKDFISLDDRVSITVETDGVFMDSKNIVLGKDNDITIADGAIIGTAITENITVFDNSSITVRNGDMQLNSSQTLSLMQGTSSTVENGEFKAVESRIINIFDGANVAVTNGDLELVASEVLSLLNETSLMVKNGDLSLNAGETLNVLNNSTLSVQGGDLELSAGENLYILDKSKLLAQDGGINLSSGSVINTFDGAELTAQNNITMQSQLIDTSDVNLTSQTGDIQLTGKDRVHLRGDAKLITKTGSILIESQEIDIDNVDFEYQNLNLALQADNSSTLSIADATFTQYTSQGVLTKGFVTVTGSSPNDYVDLSEGTQQMTLTLNAENGGSLDNYNVLINFTGVERIATGQADDKLILLAGGSISGSIDMGGGTNTAINDTNTSLYWTLSGTGNLSVGTGSQPSTPYINGIRNIMGSAHGDTLTYKDDILNGYWLISENNIGSLNGVYFTNITTANHYGPGGTFDLSGRMDNLDIQGDTMITIFPDGYFYNVSFGGGISLIDLKVVNRAVPLATLSNTGTSDEESVIFGDNLSEFLGESSRDTLVNAQAVKEASDNAENFAEFINNILDNIDDSAVVASSGNANADNQENDESKETKENTESKQAQDENQNEQQEKSDNGNAPDNSNQVNINNNNADTTKGEASE